MAPKIGRPVRGSQTGRPIMVLLDLLGRRWSLRILWELREGDRQTFRQLRSSCGDPSPTVLNTRLKELHAARLIDHQDGAGYGVTALGAELLATFLPLHQWADRWADRWADTIDD